MSSIIQMSLSIPNFSSLRVLTSCPDQTHFLTRFPQLSIHTISHRPITTIRMGGGPRTYPGGVSKWQWKRMQAKKAKQLLKARLTRERQIYEMRKRAELREAVLELEKPWEVVERAPALFSVKADEQVKVLADRFQKPGGFDFWSENDGPELFRSGGDGVGVGFPSARFFPKGVVHSVKPYESLRSGGDSDKARELGDSSVKRSNGSRRTRRIDKRKGGGGSNSEGEDGFESVRSWGNLDKSEEFKEFSSLGSIGKSSNGSRRMMKLSNGRGRGESDSERGNGGANLTLRKGNEDGKRLYSKRFAFLGGSEDRGEEKEGFGSVEGRQNLRDFNGGRGGRGSYRGTSRRNGSGERGEGKEGFGKVDGWYNSRDFNGGRGGKGYFRGSSRRNGSVERGEGMEGFSSVEGRHNSREFNGGRGGKGSYRGNSRRNGSEERGEDMEGFSSVEGRYNSREFNGGRGGKGSYRGNSSRNGGGGNLGSRNSDRLSSGNGGRNEIPFRGRAGGSGIDRQYNTRKGSSRPPRTGEVYDMSLKRDGTYEIQ